MPTPKYGTPHRTAIASVAPTPMADSITIERVVFETLNVRMERQPSDLAAAGQTRRGRVGQVVAGLQARRPARGKHERGPHLRQHVLADVVVATAAVKIEADAPARQRLADDQRGVVDGCARRERDPEIRLRV